MSGYPGNSRPHHGQHQNAYGGYAPPPGPPQQPYYGAPPGPPPGPPPPGQYGGYHVGYGTGAPQQQQQQHYTTSSSPYPEQTQQYASPSGPYRGQGTGQQYAPPSGPPPMTYNSHASYSQAQAVGPPQYQGAQFQVHMAPESNSQMYSNCSGKRKALCIGINYTGTSNALRGCHNDAQNVANFLCQRYKYQKDDIVMLMDTPTASALEIPTRANILRAMQWLVKDARPNDSLFFHYSGHGGQTDDVDGDESDGYDETIYPLDFKQAGMIIDDVMHDIMVRPLPQGCRLTSIFDCCHSGSALDLPYMYSTQGKLKEPNMMADAGSGALTALTDYMRGDIGGVLSSVTSVGKKLMTGKKTQQLQKATKSSLADVISWSGCKDTQTSADANEGGQATGAMSWAFISALSKYPQQTYLQLLNTIRDELRSKYEQKPQLSCSHELDVNLLVIF